MRVGIADAQSTLITLVSPPGDYIGQGQTYQTTSFSFTGGAGSVVASAFGFTFTIVAPSGQNFLVGTYYNTTRYPFNGIGPGIDISGNGRGCNMECGSFQILEIHVNAGGSIDRLWLKYTNSCECFMGAMTGEIRYNSILATENIPPTITTPPVAQAVVQGNTANLTVTASGSLPLSYQWYFNNANLPGQTGSVLTIPNVQPTNQGSYTVTVTNAYGSTNSIPVQLSAVPTPSCVAPPSDIISWWQGEGNALDVIGTNDGVLVGGVGFVPGKDGLAFAFTNGNSYVAIADSPSLDLSSNDFTIELWANFTSLSGSQALIAKDEGPGDTDKWIFWLNNGELQMAVDGGLNLGGGPFTPTIGQWYHLAVTRSGSIFSFYTNGVLSSASAAPVTIPVIDAPVTIGEAEGSYFMNGLEDEITIYRRALSSAEIQAIYDADSAGKCAPVVAPVVITPPQNQAVYAGQNTTFSVLAAGSSPLAYQWSVNNSNLPGATNVSLTLTNVQPGQSGNYSVLVSNLVGSTNSDSALLTVLSPGSCLPPPSDIISWWAGEGTANDSVGTNVGMLEGGATYAPGEDGLAFSFTNLGGTGFVNVPDSPSLDLSTNDFSIELWVQFVTLGGSRAFIAKDPAGGTINKWMFWLNNGQLQFQYVNGSTVVAVGTGAFNPNINQWYHVAVTRNGTLFSFYVNGTLISSGVSMLGIPPIPAPVMIGEAENNFYQGGLEDEVTIYGRALSASEIQDIYLAGAAGKCSSTVTPPQLFAQPQGGTVFQGQNITLSVLAGGSAPLGYQWTMDNTNIPGATNASLMLTNVQLSQSGMYEVNVSNSAASTNSITVLLNVLSPGSCLPPPPGIISWWAGEGTANDSLGTNGGMLEGGATYAPGEDGLAFSFTNLGGTGFVNVPDSPSLDLSTNDFSIELWVEFASVGGSRAFIAKDEGSGVLNKWIFWLNSGQLQLQLVNGPTVQLLGSGAFNPNPNQWYHVALTRQGSLFSFYLNGNLISTATSGLGIPLIAAPVTIGEAENTFYLGGLEDEVTLYRRALSGLEIQDIYLAGTTGKCAMPMKPLLVISPQSVSVPTGVNVTFQSLAAGTAPLSYQWQFDGTNIAGATNFTLQLTSIQVTQSGNYSVVITNVFGITNSSNAVLTVFPAVCDPPTGVVGWWAGEGNANDSFGTNNGVLKNGAGFAAGIVGQAFSFNGTSQYVQVPDSSNWDFGTQNYSIELWVKFSSAGGTQTLVAHDTGGGQLNKWMFWLNGGQLQMYLFSQSTGIVPIGSGTFTPAVNQWYHLGVTRNGAVFSFYVDGALDGSVTNAVAIPAASTPLTIGEAENGFYMAGEEDEVTIYDRALSPAEMQSIYDAGSAGKCLSPPVIVSQPQGETVPAEATVSFNVMATGNQPLSYQWFLNSTNIPLATNATLVLTNVQVAQSGNYSVLISNGAGSTNSSGALLAVLPPMCDPSPSGLVGWWAGESNALDSAGTNNGTLIGGNSFANGEVGLAFNFNGSSQYVDIPNSASLNPTASITCEAWIYPRQLPSAGAPVIKKAGEGTGQQDGYALELDDVRGIAFWVYISGVWWGAAPVSVPLNQWTHVAGVYDGTDVFLYINGALAETPTRVSGAISPSGNDLQIGHDPGISSRYFNGLIDEASVYSTALSSAQVQAIYNSGSEGKCPPSTPPFVVQQPTNIAAIAGTVAAFSVGARGTAPLEYQWQLNHSNILTLVNPTANTPTLILTNIQSKDSGNYSVLVTNYLGSTNSSNALLTLLFPPSITLQPRSELASVGCTVAFSSAAAGSGTLTYQWQQNGTNLPGQTGTNLALLDIQPTNFGNYTMIASNAYGAATSSVAVLGMDHLPVPGSVIVQRFPNGGIRINAGSLVTAATDADGDPISLISVASNSIAGGTVTWSGNSIYYLPPAGQTNADAFNYTLSDGHCGGTSVGTVLVEVRTDTNTASRVIIVNAGDGSVQVIFDGMPGTQYQVQGAGTLTSADWQDITNLTANQYGTYIYTDWPATNGPVRYFRSVTP